MTVAHRVLDTPLGPLTLVGDGERLSGLYYPGHTPAPDPRAFGPRRGTGLLDDAARQLAEYLAGERTAFTVATARPAASPLRHAVWRALAEIPYGETRSYSALASAVGAHPRAVGGAVAHNPLSIVVACHRVVGADGALTGYAGGLERKAALLALERAGVRGDAVAVSAR